MPDIPPQLARIVWQEFERVHRSQWGDIWPVYDGRKGLYSAASIPGVQLLPDDVSRLTNASVKPPPRTYNVVITEDNREPRAFEIAIKHVAYIDMTSLLIPGSDRQQSVLQVLDNVMRMKASLNLSAFGRSFFSSEFKTPIGGGLEVWNGYYQAVRLAKAGLVVNLDVAATAYYEAGPAVDILQRMLNRPLDRIGPMDIKKADRFFKMVKIEVTYRGVNRRSYKVNGLTETDTRQSRFHDMDRNIETTVYDYYLKSYGIQLRMPHLPCFRVGSTAKPVLIPIELANVVAAQRYPRKLNEYQTSQMIRATNTRPDQRANRNMEGPKAMGWLGHNQYLRHFNMTVANDMTMTYARILPTPSIQYHSHGREPQLVPRESAWNMQGKRLLKPMSLKCWALVCFGQERDFPMQRLREFVAEFVRGMAELGMDVECRTPPLIFASANGVEYGLREAGQRAIDMTQTLPQLIMCMLPNTGATLYGEIKRVGETVLGVVTQCIQGKHIHRPNRQYCSNVTLKVNAKLGGTNWRLTQGLPFVREAPTMVMGCDVTAPDPRQGNRPSICAVVASIDADCSQFGSSVAVQRSKHDSQMLVDIVKKHLVAFYQANNIKPKRLIFFRDGVSQGQFRECFNELKAIRDAWNELEREEPLTVTYVVCQKRHHTRLYPTNRREADRNGNTLPGTVVEEDITSPSEWDFYLNSHGSIQGTSRPAHYFVLHDENRLDNDTLQSLIFDFCHTFCRATRAVSFVTPAYYADLLAYRARFHTKGSFEDSTVASVSGIGRPSSERSGGYAAAGFAPVVGGLDGRLYFV